MPPGVCAEAASLLAPTANLSRFNLLCQVPGRQGESQQDRCGPCPHRAHTVMPEEFPHAQGHPACPSHLICPKQHSTVSHTKPVLKSQKETQQHGIQTHAASDSYSKRERAAAFCAKRQGPLTPFKSLSLFSWGSANV